MKESETMKSKMTTLVLGSLLLVAGAEAQTYNSVGDVKTYYPNGKQSQFTATVNSGTVPNPLAVSPFEALSVACSGTVITSETLLFLNDSGQTVSQSTVACGTTAGQVFSASAGSLGASAVAISATAGFSGTNSVSNYINKAPAMLQRGF